MSRLKNHEPTAVVESDSRVSPVQQSVIAALLDGKTFVEAAAIAGVTDRTIRRWRENDPVFEAALRSQIHAVRESVTVQASVAMQTAMGTLTQIAANPDHPQALRAIQMIFDLGGNLPPIGTPGTVDEISEEQIMQKVQRCAARLGR